MGYTWCDIFDLGGPPAGPRPVEGITSYKTSPASSYLLNFAGRERWPEALRRKHKGVPFVVLGNKIDVGIGNVDAPTPQELRAELGEFGHRLLDIE
ncbi:hypothetical protein VMCG_05568 [Cytospora schulzeri]|uniref:Uncharacterized protein n=1 Tax=Cytospora schulzeri TaxID=448051 RepID=A0A423WF76_9PEZI|nr:hypothetical protein VMCG_05568 [Valsa malicola]